MNTDKPLVVVTNDDGIDSFFLRQLVEKLVEKFECFVCAPDGERSWIGHAISRHEKLKPRSVKDYPCEAYALNGTPADCVNLACENLLPSPPSLVISGINLGYNITLPMILSSGTVGAAMEGALLGYRSIACSMALPNDKFEEVRKNNGKVDGKLLTSLEFCAENSAQYAELMLGMAKSPGLWVHNLNFPSAYDGANDPVITFADSLRLGGLFDKKDGQDFHQLTYRTAWLDEAEVAIGSDLWAFRENLPSVSRLDFSLLNGKSYLEP